MDLREIITQVNVLLFVSCRWEHNSNMNYHWWYEPSLNSGNFPAKFPYYKVILFLSRLSLEESDPVQDIFKKKYEKLSSTSGKKNIKEFVGLC